MAINGEIWVTVDNRRRVRGSTSPKSLRARSPTTPAARYAPTKRAPWAGLSASTLTEVS